MRPGCVAYLLYNSNDLAVSGVSDEVKEICVNTEVCTKRLLKNCFVGGCSTELEWVTNNCCRVCDKTEE